MTIVKFESPSFVENYENIIKIGDTVLPGNVVLAKDNIYKLFKEGVRNIPIITNVSFTTISDGDMTELDKDKVTITNHNVIASSFILTDISTKLIFYSNDVSYNDIGYQVRKFFNKEN